MWSEFIANNARFSLTDALDSAQCNYEDNFIEHWGLEADAPPEWLERNDWIECKRIHGYLSARFNSRIRDRVLQDAEVQHAKERR